MKHVKMITASIATLALMMSCANEQSSSTASSAPSVQEVDRKAGESDSSEKPSALYLSTQSNFDRVDATLTHVADANIVFQISGEPDAQGRFVRNVKVGTYDVILKVYSHGSLVLTKSMQKVRFGSGKSVVLTEQGNEIRIGGEE